MMNYLVGQDFSRSYIVTVTKTTRKNEYLELVEQSFIVDEPVYMDTLNLCASQFKCELCFHIAVYPCCP